MKRLIVALLLVPSLGLAAETGAAAPADPMAQWVPPKVKNAQKDKQEIQALFRTMEKAGKTGDLDAAVALMDFPVTMITDDSKGEAMGEAWSRDRWVEVMKPFYAKPMKDAKVTHKPNIFLLSDSLATVDDVCTMTQGGKTTTTRHSMFLVRKDGQWRVKSMAEGGWGDMMAESPRGTASRTERPSAEGTGSAAADQPASATRGSSAQEPSSTTGSTTQEPSSPTTGSNAKEPSSPTTGSNAKEPSSPTTGSTAKEPSSPTTGSTAKEPSSPTTGSAKEPTERTTK